jgi:hypothetical protein
MEAAKSVIDVLFTRPSRRRPFDGTPSLEDQIRTLEERDPFPHINEVVTTAEAAVSLLQGVLESGGYELGDFNVSTGVTT